MTITSLLELSVSNQGAFNVSHVSGRLALVFYFVTDVKELTEREFDL